VENPEVQRPLRRSSCRLEDNIKMDVKEVGLEGVDWIYLAEGMDKWWALLDAIMTLGVA
jgi:hypothetical protein